MITMLHSQSVAAHRRPGRRSALLDALRAADGPLRVEELASAVGIAASTAQFHLAMLVGVGMVVRTPVRSGQAGRPSWQYAISPGSPSATSYEQLARVLAAQLDDADGAAAARDAGRRWAEAVPADRLHPASRPDEAVASLASVLDRLGFSPEPRLPDGDIVLRACPFESVAREHRAVVCSVHLGLVEQAAAAIGGGIAVAGLEPFRSEQPLVCAIRLRMPAPPITAAEGVP